MFESKVWCAAVITMLSLQNGVYATHIRKAPGVMSVSNAALVQEKN